MLDDVGLFMEVFKSRQTIVAKGQVKEARLIDSSVEQQCVQDELIFILCVINRVEVARTCESALQRKCFILGSRECSPKEMFYFKQVSTFDC